MAQDKRFIKVYSQGGFTDNLMQIWVDRETGVNYLYSAYGNSGGLTVLMDRDGKPVITSVPKNYEE